VPVAVTTCPAEIRDIPTPPPSVPDGAVVSANEAGHAWLQGLIDYALGAYARLADAHNACPKV
jgi:hypothetical protein